jgi:hypothetical protein
MNFSTEFKTFAFPAELLEQLPQLIEQYGEDCQDGLQTYKTIAAGYDDSERTRLRALRFPETTSLTDLTDGRKAYTALWTLKLLEDFSSGLIPNVEELTQEQLQALLPVIEENIPNQTEENQE